jgi:transforming growth factor-beta-induced protein
VIHVIDSVILPGKTIAEVAVADGRFTTLVAALGAANLVETLSGEGPFTVFAPTDDAFAKLPAGTVEGLLADVPALTNILLYHVVSGKVMAEDVVKLTEAATVQGQKVMVKVEDGKVFINNAQVIITDIVTKNGVIHVIDTVLLPE